MVAFVGPLATIHREPRQVRKEATVVVDSCAGVWLAEVISSFSSVFSFPDCHWLYPLIQLLCEL